VINCPVKPATVKTTQIPKILLNAAWVFVFDCHTQPRRYCRPRSVAARIAEELVNKRPGKWVLPEFVLPIPPLKIPRPEIDY